MNAIAVPVAKNDHLEALPRGAGQQSAKRSQPNLLVMEAKQAFRLEIERVGTGDPPSLMLWGEEE